MNFHFLREKFSIVKYIAIDIKELAKIYFKKFILICSGGIFIEKITFCSNIFTKFRFEVNGFYF